MSMLISFYKLIIEIKIEDLTVIFEKTRI